MIYGMTGKDVPENKSAAALLFAVLIIKLCAVNHGQLLIPASISWHSFWVVLVFRYAQCVPRNSHYCTCGIHSSQTLPDTNLSPKCPNHSVKCEPHECGHHGRTIYYETVGRQVKFSYSCTNKRRLSPGLPQSSMTGLQRALRTHSCISPTTAWTKRAAIMSGNIHWMQGWYGKPGWLILLL